MWNLILISYEYLVYAMTECFQVNTLNSTTLKLGTLESFKTYAFASKNLNMFQERIFPRNIDYGVSPVVECGTRF